MKYKFCVENLKENFTKIFIAWSVCWNKMLSLNQVAIKCYDPPEVRPATARTHHLNIIQISPEKTALSYLDKRNNIDGFCCLRHCVDHCNMSGRTLEVISTLWACSVAFVSPFDRILFVWTQWRIQRCSSTCPIISSGFSENWNNTYDLRPLWKSWIQPLKLVQTSWSD